MPGLLLQLVHQFGAFGVAAGAALEGEAAVTLGGVLSRQGLFNPVACALAACLGSFLADQLVFWLAASRRESQFVRKIAARPAFARALGWIERRPALFCIAFRFIYGLRIAGPAALGFSRVRFRTFVPLNLISAAVWGATFTFIGYRFGLVAENALAKVLHTRHLAIEASGALAVIMAGLIVVHLRRGRSAPDAPPGGTPER